MAVPHKEGFKEALLSHLGISIHISFIRGPAKLWISSYLKLVFCNGADVMHEIRPSCLVMKADMANYSHTIISCSRERKPKRKIRTACY